MRSHRALALISVAVLAAACTTSAGSPAPSLVAIGTPEATGTPTPTDTPLASTLVTGGQATPGSLDPCSLLTVDEASKLIGTQLAAGVSSIVEPVRVCTWKTGTATVKLFLAPPATSGTTAQDYWDGAMDMVQADLSTEPVAGFDRAAYGNGTAMGVPVSALFVIHGAQFFDLYCGYPECSETASVAAANLIVGRLP
jgi:hypothetical protein